MSADLSAIDLAHAGPLRLGGLEVRPPTCEVAGPAGRETLQPRIMQVLVALTTAHGEVVSRDDLIRRCWEGRAVGDDAINRCIAKLRQVGAQHAAFTVETVPRVGYRLVVQAAPAAPTEMQRAKVPVLAVLPFENLSSDTELQFFSDGVSEEILSAVSRLGGVRVIGSTSSFSFRGARKSEAARALNATHVLDGSVRRGGARVRIAAQLTEAESGQVLWSERYDRDTVDVLAVQDEIAALTAQALSVRFSRGAPRPQLDPRAYDIYLHARLVRRDSGAQEKAIAYLRAALEIEPDFAAARACLAFTLCTRIVSATTAGAPPEAYDAAV